MRTVADVGRFDAEEDDVRLLGCCLVVCGDLGAEFLQWFERFEASARGDDFADFFGLLEAFDDGSADDSCADDCYGADHFVRCLVVLACY